MARRSRSSFNPAWLIAGVVVLALGFGLGSYFLSSAGQPFRTTADLEVAAYLENSNSLRGNTYKVEGEILNVLGYSPSQGRLISVRIDGTDEVVPMLIPTSFSHINIQRGQRFTFQIEVTDRGILRAIDLNQA